MGNLTKREISYLEQNLKRKANEVEQDIVGAEWSEHCSYKSSKKYLRLLPTKGKHVLVGPGYDAGAFDLGDGYVLTVHIESHNHPSAVEPYGGAATGVGGVIRDIMSMGTRPIAILDALRFAPITSETKKYSKSKWLFKNVVRGIGDYGNCIGVPTVGGEVEFDPSFQDYCLVDVASIGFGIRGQIIENKVDTDDLIILAGGSTGRDGIHGSSFASAILQEENRSAVQLPDPFLEKLLVEATAEAVEQCCIKAMKDLGGGGLSCCLAETADNLKRGFDIELTNVHVKHQNMSPSEIMISESQERMLYITDGSKINRLISIFKKYEIPYALIGKVTDGHSVIIRFCGKVVADLPAELFAHAPTAHRGMQRPQYLDRLEKSFDLEENTPKLNSILLAMLSSPTIANKNWVYQQYDHEVGLRTIVKPGQGDASVMRIGNGKFASIKLDGNSKHCYLDPYQGTLGCLSEACRNIICTGGEPIGVVDHLQFASPEDPKVYWTFKQAVDAIIDYCTFTKIPVVGGKVSFYNETNNGPIKPSPVMGMVGLISDASNIMRLGLHSGDTIFIIGQTNSEMGGSEYYEYFHNLTGGLVPKVDLEIDNQNGNAVLKLIRSGLVSCAHDCSKGGLAVALAEMAIVGSTGLMVELGAIPNACSGIDDLLFSESHSRYIVGTRDPDGVRKQLSSENIVFAEIGNANGKRLKFKKGKKAIIELNLRAAEAAFYSLERRIYQ